MNDLTFVEVLYLRLCEHRFLCDSKQLIRRTMSNFCKIISKFETRSSHSVERVQMVNMNLVSL